MADLTLRAPEPLIIDITSTSMGTTWENWLEQLEMYFIAANIEIPKRQKALLLYCGGNELQKLYRTLIDEGETFGHRVRCLFQAENGRDIRAKQILLMRAGRE